MERKDFKKHFKKRLLELKESKPFIASLTLISAVCVVAAGTYAFTSYTEWVKNHFQSSGSALDVRIVEDFDAKTVTPGIEVTKKVQVRNTSSHKGLIRVKLDESFISFVVDVTDQTGNANLKTVNTAGNAVDRAKTETWKADNTYESNLKDLNGNKLYYTAKDPIINQAIGIPDNRNSFLKSMITIAFNSNVYFSKPNPLPTNDYWLYDATSGYFYYSRALSGDETTDTALINKLSAASEISNDYKGSLYKLNVTAEGVYANEGGLTSWVTSGDIFNMLITQIDN